MALYIRQKRSKVKDKLVQHRLKEKLTSRVCPKCSGQLDQVEGDVYHCPKCRETSTLSPLPPHVVKKSKEIQLGAIKLVDKSRDRKYDYTNKTGSARGVSADVITMIRKAMQEKKLLQFDYPRDKDLVSRITEPYKLALDGSKNLVLWAYCTEAEGIRIFKLDKIKNMSMQEYTYKPRWEIEDKLDENSKKDQGKA